MDMLLLIKTIATLTGVLGVLIFFYFYFTYKNPSKQKKISQKPLHVREVKPDFNILLEVIKDKKSTTQELKEAVDLIIQYYGRIPKRDKIRGPDKIRGQYTN